MVLGLLIPDSEKVTEIPERIKNMVITNTFFGMTQGYLITVLLAILDSK